MNVVTGRRPRLPWMGAVVDWLPRGGALDEAAWNARHRGICALLWVHVAAMPAIALLRGETLTHGLLEAAAIAGPALGAHFRTLSVRARSDLATLGLVTSSAVVVHLFDGLIELHFHFFVMVAVVALYQTWQPFLLALGFVILHHSLTGTFAPHAVYNHPAAISDPWLWGLVHGGFVLAESVACLIYWRASEAALLREREARLGAQAAHRDLARAQELSGVGSWEWDPASDTVSWSDQLYALAGVDRTSFVPSLRSFLDLVHADDRSRVAELIRTAYETGSDLDYECRMTHPDGTIRTVHALGEASTDEHGTVVQMRGTCHDVTERRQMQDEIAHLAFHDTVTSLANRRLFIDRLDHALANMERAGDSVAILFIDLDDFKHVNDSYGHAAGDALLQDVAARLRSAVRAGDTIARFGGDEFAVLCEGADLDAATRTAARIGAELRASSAIDGTPVPLTASIGVAVAHEDTSADTLLREADTAMYAVKARRKQAAPTPPSPLLSSLTDAS